MWENLLSERKHKVLAEHKHYKYVKASSTQGTVFGDWDSAEVIRVTL